MEKDFSNVEAIAKLRQLAEDIDFAMLATALSELPIHMVPMSTKKVDESGRIWFLSGADSTHNQHIKRQSDVHLIYSNAGTMQFLNVYGTAVISTDKKILASLYGKADDAWFDGVDDPNLTAISIVPRNAYYWDPTSNKLVTLFKLGLAAITGRQPEVLQQGELKV